MKIQTSNVELEISETTATIQNAYVAVVFNLATGDYSGIDRTDNCVRFRNAWSRVGEGGWQEPTLTCEAMHQKNVNGAWDKGETLRVW